MSGADKEIPSEYRISEKWDKCLENFTLHFTAGLVAGGLTSLVLARASLELVETIALCSVGLVCGCLT